MVFSPVHGEAGTVSVKFVHNLDGLTFCYSGGERKYIKMIVKYCALDYCVTHKIFAALSS